MSNINNDWQDLPIINATQLISNNPIELVPAKEGYSVELNGNQYRYVKAEPLCDIERNRFDLFNKNNNILCFSWDLTM